MQIHPPARSFGHLPTGESVEVYTLANAAGASVDVSTYGGTVTALRVPDRDGVCADVVLGFDTLAGYLAGTAYFGAIIGRVAGRIRAGRIVVDGQPHALPVDGRSHQLHGGARGFDKRLWTAQPATRDDGADSLHLTYTSPAGEEGYPGNVQVAVTYTLGAAGEFVVETEATADRATPLALTHHSYFNLAGAGSATVADHEIQIAADAVAPTGDDMLSTGRREPVAGQAADFNRPRRLGDALPALPQQGHGDFYFLRAPGASVPAAPTLAARVVEPRSGRVLEVFTDEPGLQFYTGSSLGAQPPGKSGAVYGPFSGLCLECQGHAESTTYPEFGDILVRPGTPQHRRTVYAFSTL